MTEIYDYWRFIENNLPNYSFRNDVALSCDLAAFLDEDDQDALENIVKAGIAPESAAEYRFYLDARLYIEAYENKHKKDGNNVK